MNDFFELESELRKLRPAPPSPVLRERIEQSLGSCRASASDAKWKFRRRFIETPYGISSLGFGLAAVSVLILFAVVTIEHLHERPEIVAQASPAPVEGPVAGGTEKSPGRFVSAGGTDVVYNARDEGLQFADGSTRPVRRLRYQTRQTWRWRNPETGASLRVSYPSEEVVLIPVSGQ
jgi:hypothetical protein